MTAIIASYIILTLWSTALVGIPVCAFYEGK